ncbi:MAG: hypothetical protein HQK78_14760 [Desulfobacterales bacterium]|nr:hypothetical protein [Desulfobacterales bacterium]
MSKDIIHIKEIILKAAQNAIQETGNEPEPELTKKIDWPIKCSVGPGLEGAIACESKIGYVNGSKGWLVYRGYNIFDLCAYSNFEEVSFLLLHGRLPNSCELETYKQKLINYGNLNKTLRLLMAFPVEKMHVMAALRLGTNLMRQEFTILDTEEGKPDINDAIASDEDSIAMETIPFGSNHAVYEFDKQDTRWFKKTKAEEKARQSIDSIGFEACYHLIAGVSVIVAAISRIHSGKLPLEPNPDLSFAGNLLYMISGKIPSPIEERIMDYCSSYIKDSFWQTPFRT